MKKLIGTLSLALSIMFLSVAAQASEMFVANLTSGQEVPTNGSNGKGIATATVDATSMQLIITVAFSGLTSNQTAGGILGPARVGLNGVGVFNLGATNTTTGTLTGTFPLTTVQLDQLRSHQLYVNLSTVNFANGEIRGQLKESNQTADFDGDGRAEIGVYRNSNGNWYLYGSLTGGIQVEHWGAMGDILTPGDFDGDGRTDHAIWRNGTFYVFRSRTHTVQAQPWGAMGDDPRVVGDWNNDGMTDFAVYREGTPAIPQSIFYILNSSTGTVSVMPWGTMGDTSLMGDWDGDGINDAAVYRRATGTYFVQKSSTGGLIVQAWGNFATDTVTPADYDGDGKTDFAVFRNAGPGAGTWHILGSASGYVSSAFGVAGDVAVPADFDGDGRDDLAVYRGGVWFMNQSTLGFNAMAFGAANDEPIPKYRTR